MGAKSKTIKRVLKHKLDEWIETIDNEAVRDAVRNDVFVTGGSIASMLIGETINDFDVYFKTKETTLAVARYYVHKFIELNPNTDVKPEVRLEVIKNLKGEEEERVVVWVQSAGAAGEEPQSSGASTDEAEASKERVGYSYFEITDNADGDLADQYVEQMLSGVKSEAEKKKGEYRPVFMSQNAITLSDKLQIVIRFFGQPEDIYKNYDFVHVMQHYDYKSDQLHLNQKALEALLSRTLIYTGSLYPICSVFRAKKFIERGWKVSAGQLLKMCYQLKDIDWSNMKMVREQLTGVDAAYFHQLIRLMEVKQGEQILSGGCMEIDDAYLVKLIDHIFEGTPLD